MVLECSELCSRSEDKPRRLEKSCLSLAKREEPLGSSFTPKTITLYFLSDTFVALEAEILVVRLGELAGREEREDGTIEGWG